MKKDQKDAAWWLLGTMLLLYGLIMLGGSAYQFASYKFSHPEMTETQLQLRALSTLKWIDLLHFAAAISGLAVMAWKK